jgi:hypothetical protein
MLFWMLWNLLGFHPPGVGEERLPFEIETETERSTALA